MSVASRLGGIGWTLGILINYLGNQKVILSCFRESCNNSGYIVSMQSYRKLLTAEKASFKGIILACLQEFALLFSTGCGLFTCNRLSLQKLER